MHGGVAKTDLGPENVDAVKRGLPNLQRHLENIRKFGLKPVVAVNHFTSDTEAEFAVVQDACKALGAEAFLCSHWAEGGKGTENLARAVLELVKEASTFHTLYPDAMPLAEKIRTVATQVYGAGMVEFAPDASKKLAQYEKDGFGNLPVCMAKTQYSFSSDPALMGAPKDFVLPVRDVRLSAGAGFVVALCGDIMTMPGLPKIPAAERIGVNENGEIFGIF
jgi:formate--tetrahydrofolate ligase